MRVVWLVIVMKFLYNTIATYSDIILLRLGFNMIFSVKTIETTGIKAPNKTNLKSKSEVTCIGIEIFCPKRLNL